MPKQKFVYNLQTLRFEKVEASLKAKLLKGFAYFSAASVYAAVVVFIAYQYFDSPKERMLRREISQMSEDYNILNKQVDMLGAAINNMHARDNGIYRVMLEQKPIDDGIWNAGVGGSDKYEAYKNLSEGDLLKKTNEKISKLRNQIKVQAESHGQIIEEFAKKEDRIVSIPSIKPVREDKLNKSMQLLSGFGYRLHPILKTWKLHTGIDFGAPSGTSIYSTGKGTVVRVEFKNSGYGHSVVISHGYGYETLYGHMSEILVKPGQQVVKGQIIGRVGSTGTSTGPHCHYEVIKDGEKINPMHYCLDGLTPGEFQDFVERANQGGTSFDYYTESDN